MKFDTKEEQQWHLEAVVIVKTVFRVVDYLPRSPQETEAAVECVMRELKRTYFEERHKAWKYDEVTK